MPLDVHGDAKIVKDPVHFDISDPDRMGIKLRVVSSNPRKREGENDFFYNTVMFVRKTDKRVPFLKLGREIFIRSGEWTVRSYTDKDTGRKREWHEVLINHWRPATWVEDDTQTVSQAHAEETAATYGSEEASSPTHEPVGVGASPTTEEPPEMDSDTYPPPPRPAQG